MCNCKNVSNLYPGYCPICGSKWKKKEEPFNPNLEVTPKVGETWVDTGGQKHLILHVHAHLYATVVYGSHYWIEREQLNKKHVEPVKQSRHVYLLQGNGGPPFISFSEHKNQVIGYKLLAYKQIEITEGEGV